jgi:multisubunit Na+/H+ antiporter MnhB subunit
MVMRTMTTLLSYTTPPASMIYLLVGIAVVAIAAYAVNMFMVEFFSAYWYVYAASLTKLPSPD